MRLYFINLRRNIYLEVFQHAEYSGDDADYKRSRFRVSTDTDGFWGGYLDIGLGAVDNDGGVSGSNWLQEIWVSQRFGRFELREGRIFSSGGYTTYWPGLFWTTRYPAVYPWGTHFWGVQLYTDRTNHRFTFDVGAQTGGDFDGKEAFDDFELGAMYRWKTKGGNITLAVQTDDGDLRVGNKFDLVAGRFGFSGGVFYTNEEDVDQDWTGVFTIRGQIASWGSNYQNHFLAVGQREWRKDGTSPYTWGLGLKLNRYYLVVDHDDEGSWGGRIQYLLKVRLY